MSISKDAMDLIVKPAITLVSAATAEVVLYPVDSMKTWSQTTTRKPWVKSSLQHYAYIFKQAYGRGGIRSFYHGLNMSVARCSLSTAAVLGYGKNVNTKLSYFTKMGVLTPAVSKVCSSFIVSTISNGMLVPVDTIKVRLQADGRKHEDVRRYTGPFHACSEFVKRNGIRALWNGSAPMLARSTMWWTSSIPAYNVSKSFLHDFLYHFPKLLTFFLGFPITLFHKETFYLLYMELYLDLVLYLGFLLMPFQYLKKLVQQHPYLELI